MEGPEPAQWEGQVLGGGGQREALSFYSERSGVKALGSWEAGE